jgi:hypothetical protein
VPRCVFDLGDGVHDLDVDDSTFRVDSNDVVLTPIAGLRPRSHHILNPLQFCSALPQDPQLFLSRQQCGKCLANLEPPFGKRRRDASLFGGDIQLCGFAARLALAEHQLPTPCLRRTTLPGLCAR